jgi:hypothetical protein
MTQNDLNFTQDNANREMVAISVEMDRLLARMVQLGQHEHAWRRGAATNFLWEAHERLKDARTNLEMSLGLNR